MPAALGKALSRVLSRGRAFGSQAMGKAAGIASAASERAPGVKAWATTPSLSRRMAGISAMGAVGYGTSPDDADMGQRLGRTVGFMAGAGWLARRSGAAPGALTGAARDFGGALTGNFTRGTGGRGVERYYMQGGKRYRATGFMGNRSARARGHQTIFSGTQEVGFMAGRGSLMQDAWGGVKSYAGMQGGFRASHSIGLCAMYGLVSDETSVLEGAIGGAMVHGGVKIGMSGLRAGQWGGVANAWKGKKGGRFLVDTAGGITREAPVAGSFTAARKAAGRLPLMRVGAGFGIVAGAYGGMGEGTSSVLTGGMIGGLKGGIGGGLAKAGLSHPLVTMGTLGAGAVVAGGAAEAYSQWEGAGHPGMNDMDADGELALALHQTRHSY